ncbi:MAG: two-component system, NtrC family, sensor kinase [Acidobacteriota bacterium]|jgi:PAS domain S-box-containing protein|nr:two-component system, NtrC family, sensor kinase [Acidobacteriota bacterium]
MVKSIFTKLLIAAVTVAIVIGGFASFQRKRSSFERIDFTFRRDKGVIVVKAIDPGSGAEASGLQPGDHIWLIGDTPTTEIEGLQKTLRRIGTPVPMIVQRGDQTLTLTYRAPELKIDYAYLILSFIGFLYLAIGLFTLFRGATRESLLFYFVTLLSFVVYVYTPAGDADTSYKILQLVEDFARIALPPLTLNFFLLFPRPIVRHRGLIAALYLPPLLVLLWDIDLFIFANALPLGTPAWSFGVMERWTLAHFAIYFTLAVVALAYTYRTAAAVGKKQIKWIYLGMVLGFVPFLLVYLVPYLLVGSVKPIYLTISILPLAFIPLAFAVSILKYKLWDVEVVIKEVLAYSVTFVFGMIAFSTINLLLSRVIEERSAMERNFLAFSSGLLIAGVLIPVKGRVESVIERFVYRDSYRHRRAMAEFAQELATFNDVHELIAMMRERMSAALEIGKMNLFTREGNAFLIYEEEAGVPRRCVASEFGTIPPEGPVVLNEPRLPDASEVPWLLLRAGYRYVFPLRNRGELQGLLLLGTKRGEEPLSRDDLHLLESLTAPLALAIENSRLTGRLRRQLDEIRALKEYNENIIESSSSAIAVIASDGTVLTANKAFWEVVGGEGIPGIFNDPIDTLFPPYAEVRADDSARTIETNFVNRNGVEKQVTVTASPLHAGDVEDGARVLVIGDISERIRLERELQDKERLASLGLLAAGVAHEVNTPLTGISSYAQLLLADTEPDDPKYRVLKKMEQQTFRASNLVNSLLELISNRPRSRELLNVRDLIEQTLVLHEDLLKLKAIRVNFEPMDDVRIRGNFHDLQQVLTNVLLNARDAVDEGGHIDIRVREEGERVCIRIKDDGKGIAPDIIGRIFEPLVTTKRGQGGTGLGLAISRRIVNASDGEITVQSSPGRGAEFSISFPRVVVTAKENWANANPDR